MLAILSACGDEGTPAAGAGGETERGPEAGRICPSCRSDVAGTETSDFSGSESSCSGDPATAPGDPAWNARLEEVRGVYAGPFEASLHWAYVGLVESDSAGAFWEARPSGYEPITSVLGNVTLEPTQFYKGRPTNPSAEAGLDCPDWYHVPLTVEFATADGALAGTASGNFRLGLGAAVARASVDLARALGTLDLHLDPELEYRGSASLNLQFHPEGKRGQISVEVSPVETRRDIELGYWPLSSDFPDDGCTNGFPSTANAPLPWLDGLTAAQALQSWNTEIGDSPTQGLRHDCAPGSMAEAPVELSFDIGAPDASICQLPAWPAAGIEGGFSFGGTPRLRTSDGRIDMPFIGGSATPTSLELSSDPALYPNFDPSLLIPAEQFATESGIRDVHPGNSPVLGYYSAAYFSRGDGTLATGGTLSVMGLNCSGESCFISVHSDVRWPVDESASIPLCRL